MQKQIVSSYVEISYSPRWAYVQDIREFIKNFCISSDLGNELADKIMIVSSEMLENAIKYSCTEEIQFRMQIYGDKNEVTITAKNSCEQKNMEILQREVDFVNSQSPEEAYLKKLSSVSENPEISRLGLSRIRYETQATFALRQEDDCVVLSCNLPIMAS